MAEPSAPAGDGDALSLYVHWPFCLAKCPYCDFNSHVRDAVDHEKWRAALLAELDHYADETGGRRLASIFFGGGTPSLMAPATAAAVIDQAARRWPPAADIEITLEANPTSVEAAKLADFRAAGINRISLGVQSLDDRALAMLGRRHSAGEAIAAIDAAAGIFPRYSFDLIYARPGQTIQAWRSELRRAIALAGDHLSVYQLTLEKGTPLYAAYRRGEFVPMQDDDAAALFEETGEMLSGAGLPAYEISNHAAPGSECRHNLVYWLSGDYAGIGPGAHGRLTAAGETIATEQTRAPERWLDAVARDGHATHVRRTVPAAERVEEMLMMGLRLRTGIPRSTFRRVAGREPAEALDQARLDRLAAGGFVVLDDDGLRATETGRQRLDSVLAALIG